MFDRHYEAYCAEGRYKNLFVRYTANTYPRIIYYARKILRECEMIDSVCIKNHKGEVIKVLKDE